MTTALPTAPPAGGGPIPDYRISSIVGAATAAAIDIDAISIGLDLIHADSAGVLHPPPPPALALLTFSVTPASAAAFGPVLTEATATDGSAADLFSYWVQRGVGTLREGIDLAVDSTESRIFCGGQRGNMDAHDLYMPLYATTGGWMIAMLLQAQQAFYFSVTTATVPACPVAWWAGTVPSGATVLFSTWTGAGWTPIRPFVTHAQLGLPASADLDAFGGPQPSSVPWPFPTTGSVALGSHRTPLGFQFMLQGCPPAGCTGGPGVLFFNLPGGLLPITTLTLFQPPATNLLQVPLPFAQPSPVLGAALDVYWVRADLTLTSLDASQAMRINF